MVTFDWSANRAVKMVRLKQDGSNACTDTERSDNRSASAVQSPRFAPMSRRTSELPTDRAGRAEGASTPRCGADRSAPRRARRYIASDPHAKEIVAPPRILGVLSPRPDQTEASSGRLRNRLECGCDAFPTLLVAPAADQRATGRAHLLPRGFVHQQPLESARKRSAHLQPARGTR